MSQNDLVIDNQSFPATRSDINSALQALGSLNSGATAPATTYANMMWYDTTNNILKMRSEANDAWISIGTLDQSANTFSPSGIPTQATAVWEAGTDTTESLVSAAKVAAAIAALAEADALTLLGTLTTTSGTTQVLSGLDLTPYKEVHISGNDVSHAIGGDESLELEGELIAANISGGKATDFFGSVSLHSGVGVIGYYETSVFAPSTGVLVVQTGLSTASTSLTFQWTSGSFDAGEIKVWGMR